ncbi:unnamed protein product [Amoebophrya sp. A120]|nr:unnamed protein product [Amoebophrya sp. A120]|eukprot:GSA120T00022779001.1
MSAVVPSPSPPPFEHEGGTHTLPTLPPTSTSWGDMPHDSSDSEELLSPAGKSNKRKEDRMVRKIYKKYTSSGTPTGSDVDLASSSSSMHNKSSGGHLVDAGGNLNRLSHRSNMSRHHGSGAPASDSDSDQSWSYQYFFARNDNDFDSSALSESPPPPKELDYLGTGSGKTKSSGLGLHHQGTKGVGSAAGAYSSQTSSGTPGLSSGAAISMHLGGWGHQPERIQPRFHSIAPTGTATFTSTTSSSGGSAAKGSTASSQQHNVDHIGAGRAAPPGGPHATGDQREKINHFHPGVTRPPPGPAESSARKEFGGQRVSGQPMSSSNMTEDNSGNHDQSAAHVYSGAAAGAAQVPYHQYLPQNTNSKTSTSSSSSRAVVGGPSARSGGLVGPGAAGGQYDYDQHQHWNAYNYPPQQPYHAHDPRAGGSASAATYQPPHQRGGGASGYSTPASAGTADMLAKGSSMKRTGGTSWATTGSSKGAQATTSTSKSKTQQQLHKNNAGGTHKNNGGGTAGPLAPAKNVNASAAASAAPVGYDVAAATQESTAVGTTGVQLAPTAGTAGAPSTSARGPRPDGVDGGSEQPPLTQFGAPPSAYPQAHQHPGLFAAQAPTSEGRWHQHQLRDGVPSKGGMTPTPTSSQYREVGPKLTAQYEVPDQDDGSNLASWPYGAAVSSHSHLDGGSSTYAGGHKYSTLVMGTAPGFAATGNAPPSGAALAAGAAPPASGLSSVPRPGGAERSQHEQHMTRALQGPPYTAVFDPATQTSQQGSSNNSQSLHSAYPNSATMVPWYVEGTTSSMDKQEAYDPWPAQLNSWGVSATGGAPATALGSAQPGAAGLNASNHQLTRPFAQQTSETDMNWRAVSSSSTGPASGSALPGYRNPSAPPPPQHDVHYTCSQEVTSSSNLLAPGTTTSSTWVGGSAAAVVAITAPATEASSATVTTSSKFTLSDHAVPLLHQVLPTQLAGEEVVLGAGAGTSTSTAGASTAAQQHQLPVPDPLPRSGGQRSETQPHPELDETPRDLSSGTSQQQLGTYLQRRRSRRGSTKMIAKNAPNLPRKEDFLEDRDTPNSDTVNLTESQPHQGATDSEENELPFNKTAPAGFGFRRDRFLLEEGDATYFDENGEEMTGRSSGQQSYSASATATADEVEESATALVRSFGTQNDSSPREAEQEVQPSSPSQARALTQTEQVDQAVITSSRPRAHKDEAPALSPQEGSGRGGRDSSYSATARAVPETSGAPLSVGSGKIRDDGKQGRNVKLREIIDYPQSYDDQTTSGSGIIDTKQAVPGLSQGMMMTRGETADRTEQANAAPQRQEGDEEEKNKKKRVSPASSSGTATTSRPPRVVPNTTISTLSSSSSQRERHGPMIHDSSASTEDATETMLAGREKAQVSETDRASLLALFVIAFLSGFAAVALPSMHEIAARQRDIVAMVRPRSAELAAQATRRRSPGPSTATDTASTATARRQAVATPHVPVSSPTPWADAKSADAWAKAVKLLEKNDFSAAEGALLPLSHGKSEASRKAQLARAFASISQGLRLTDARKEIATLVAAAEPHHGGSSTAVLSLCGVAHNTEGYLRFLVDSDPRGAVRSFLQAVRCQELNPYPWSNLGVAALYLNELELARAALGAALRMARRAQHIFPLQFFQRNHELAEALSHGEPVASDPQLGLYFLEDTDPRLLS